LTRDGYFETPANATASSRISSSGSTAPLDCISRRNSSCTATAAPTGLPTTRSVSTDVDAWLIEQPAPSYETSSTTPPATFTRSVTSSPQVGFTWCTSASYGSRRPRPCGCL
jgi:hypothetical protein